VIPGPIDPSSGTMRAPEADTVRAGRVLHFQFVVNAARWAASFFIAAQGPGGGGPGGGGPGGGGPGGGGSGGGGTGVTAIPNGTSIDYTCGVQTACAEPTFLGRFTRLGNSSYIGRP